MASLEVRKGKGNDPKAKICIRFYDPACGNNRTKVTKFYNTRDGWIQARKYLKEFEANKNNSEFIEKFDLENSKGQIFSIAWDKFVSVSTYKPSTSAMYTKTKSLWLELHEDKFICEYKALDYMEFISYMEKECGYAPNSQSMYSRCLKRFFNWCIEVSYTKTNIAKKSVKQVLKPVKTIPLVHLHEILKEIKASENTSAYNIILFMYLSGFRVSTALEIKWNNINWLEGIIEVPNVKTGRVDLSPLTKNIECLLKRMGVKKNGNIFPEYSDGRAVRRVFVRAQQRLIKLDKENKTSVLKVERCYTTHQLRKSFATRMINSGLLTMNDVSQVAQHKNEQTTKRHYYEVEMKRLRVLMDKADSNLNFFEEEENATPQDRIVPVYKTSLGNTSFSIN